jgi:DNA processing protein
MTREITENEYAHWLFNVPGLGNKSIDKLLCGGWKCGELFEIDSKELKGILTAKQIKNFEESRRIWNFEAEKEKLKAADIRFIPRIDNNFPEKLKTISDPPFAIYVKGKLPDPAKPSVAIIGARMCSEYGRYMARQFGRGLAMAGVQVISGLAMGVDGVSQKAALLSGGKSFGILGSGVDICYPEENREIYNMLIDNGGLISELPPGTMPKACFFPMRNRIISGLADVVLVIEAREKSGTQITVDTALEQGRDVLAVPGRVTDRLSDGCNLLISQGAGVALDVQDVLERLHRSKASPPLTVNKKAGIDEIPYIVPEPEESLLEPAEEKIEDQILSILDIIPVSASFIMEELYKAGREVSIPELMRILMDMSYNGLIVQNGAYYRKIA